MNPILEIPNGLSDAQLLQILNQRIRDINTNFGLALVSPALADLDMGNHRIVKTFDPKDDLDVVNLRTLKRLSPGASPAVVTSTGSGKDFYAFIWSQTDFLSDGEAVPCFIVDEGREGTPMRAWFKCKTAPASDATFNMQINGVNLLETNAVIPAGTTDPVFMSNLAISPSMGKGTQVDLVIVTGGAAALFSAGLVVKRT